MLQLYICNMYVLEYVVNDSIGYKFYIVTFGDVDSKFEVVCLCVYKLVSCTCHPHGSKLGLAFALNVPMMDISKKTENEKTQQKNCKPFEGDAENTPIWVYFSTTSNL